VVRDADLGAISCLVLVACIVNDQRFDDDELAPGHQSLIEA